MNRQRHLFLALLVTVAAALTVSGIAVAAGQNPAKSLVLQKSDFPKGAKIKVLGADHNAGGSSYAVMASYTAGSKPIELLSSVSILRNRSHITELYRDSKSEIPKFVTRLQLPKYGDEQFAVYHPLWDGQLMVRKGNTLWVIQLHVTLESPLTTAEAMAEFKKYASKQQRRIG